MTPNLSQKFWFFRMSETAEKISKQNRWGNLREEDDNRLGSDASKDRSKLHILSGKVNIIVIVPPIFITIASIKLFTIFHISVSLNFAICALSVSG